MNRNFLYLCSPKKYLCGISEKEHIYYFLFFIWVIALGTDGSYSFRR